MDLQQMVCLLSIVPDAADNGGTRAFVCAMRRFNGWLEIVHLVTLIFSCLFSFVSQVLIYMVILL